MPDNKKLTIYYEARISAAPNQQVSISNNAYWMGYPSDQPQIDNKAFKYILNGDVFITNLIRIKITKVDADNHHTKLAGAEFELWEADSNGNKIGIEAIRKGTAGSNGELIFTQNSSEDEAALKFNTVYCLIETRSPDGYELASAPHYFVIINDPDAFDPQEYPITDLELWYDSPTYSYTMTDKKGTISVEKIFRHEDGTIYTPTAGSYRFGLYDTNKINSSTRPLEILTITYTQANAPRYDLDGVVRDTPSFTNYEPDGVYYIYELDEDGNPITDNTLRMLNGTSYYVDTVSGNRVMVNGKVTIENTEIPDTSIVLGGTKTLNVTPADSSVMLADGQFTFELYAGTASYTDRSKPETGIAPLPEGAVDGKLLTTNQDGVFAFDQITFTRPGVYTYTIKEQQGNDTGYTYDDTTYTVTVTVVWNAEERNYQTSAVYAVNGGETSDRAAFTNCYNKPVDLILHKTVTGSTGDKEKNFIFDVILTPPEGAALTDSYQYTLTDSGTELSAGTVRLIQGRTDGYIVKMNGSNITLKHDQSMIIHGLPAGTMYSITEADYSEEGYYTSVNGNADSNMTGILDSDDTNVNFVNYHPAGGVWIHKKVEGTDADLTKAFVFNVILTDTDGNLPENTLYNVFSAGEKVGVIENGSGTVTLTHNQMVHIEGLPIGTQVTVKEVPDEQYEMDVDASADGIELHTEFVDNGIMVTVPDETDSTAQMVTIHFTNTQKTGNLSIEKHVTGTGGDKEKDFHFLVELEDMSINGIYGDMTFENGKAEITLKDNESKTAAGLPAGIAYTVTEQEANQNGYTTTMTNNEGVILADKTISIHFVNDKADMFPETDASESESSAVSTTSTSITSTISTSPSSLTTDAITSTDTKTSATSATSTTDTITSTDGKTSASSATSTTDTTTSTDIKTSVSSVSSTIDTTTSTDVKTSVSSVSSTTDTTTSTDVKTSASSVSVTTDTTTSISSAPSTADTAAPTTMMTSTESVISTTKAVTSITTAPIDSTASGTTPIIMLSTSSTAPVTTTTASATTVQATMDINSITTSTTTAILTSTYTTSTTTAISSLPITTATADVLTTSPIITAETTTETEIETQISTEVKGENETSMTLPTSMDEDIETDMTALDSTAVDQATDINTSSVTETVAETAATEPDIVITSEITSASYETTSTETTSTSYLPASASSTSAADTAVSASTTTTTAVSTVTAISTPPTTTTTASDIATAITTIPATTETTTAVTTQNSMGVSHGTETTATLPISTGENTETNTTAINSITNEQMTDITSNSTTETETSTAATESEITSAFDTTSASALTTAVSTDASVTNSRTTSGSSPRTKDASAVPAAVCMVSIAAALLSRSAKKRD